MHYNSVVKNITLSAEENQIRRARLVASRRHTTLNQMFREWLGSLDGSPLRSQGYRDVMGRLGNRVKVGGRSFSREEMNER